MAGVGKGGWTPWWTIAAPLGAGAILALKFSGLIPSDAILSLIIAAIFLGASVFAAVHHAEVVALRVGEPFGSIILAVAVTVIEVALIVSIMLGGAPGSEAVARDTVFAAAMIVLNIVVGLCLLVGGRRHLEQAFRLDGTAAALAVLGTLATLAMILPSHTTALPGPFYSASQLVFVSLASLVLYGAFIFVQTIRHRDYFVAIGGQVDAEGHVAQKPSDAVAWRGLVLLLLSLTAVILLAKLLSQPLENAIDAAGLPRSFVGVVIAMIVLLPEGIASVRAAAANHIQTSLNLALGSALASIGLTIPVVSAVAIYTGNNIALGLGPEETTLLVLSLFVATLTLGTGRTTVLQGIVHLVIGCVFIFLAATH
jgi:Ca2+:H+ antiporter